VDQFGSRHISSISCGLQHGALVADGGQLYTWGRSKEGQLGHGAYSADLKTPQLVTSLIEKGLRVSVVACGKLHTVAVTTGGQLYAWGANSRGQLGIPNVPNQLTPCSIQASASGGQSAFTSVAAGDSHTIALDSLGSVWTWGSNDHGELGRNVEVGIPGQIPELSDVSSVDAGAAHSVALTTTGKLFSWGCGENGQLGHRVRCDCNNPKEVSEISELVLSAAACGAAHTMALDSATGQLWGWGLNQHGQLGSSAPFFDHATPQPVDALRGCKVEQVSCGWGSTVALDSEGQRVWQWGYTRSGTTDGNPVPIIIRAGSEVKHIRCGGLGVVALVKTEGTEGLWTRHFSESRATDPEEQVTPSQNPSARPPPPPFSTPPITPRVETAPGITPRTAALNDKQVLEQQLEEEVQCLSDAEQRLEAALQKLAPKKEEHDALANKFKVLVQSEQEVVSAQNKAHAQRVFESKSLELEQLDLERDTQAKEEEAAACEEQLLVLHQEIEQYKEALELAGQDSKGCMEAIQELEKEKNRLVGEYDKTVDQRIQVTKEEMAVVGKLTEYDQLKMAVVENKIRLAVLKEDLEDKKRMVGPAIEKNDKIGEELNEINRKIETFTENTNNEIAQLLEERNQKEEEAAEVEAEIQEIRIRMGSKLPQSPERESTLRYAAQFGY